MIEIEIKVTKNGEVNLVDVFTGQIYISMKRIDNHFHVTYKESDISDNWVIIADSEKAYLKVEWIKEE
jgi:hypothetical protein